MNIGSRLRNTPGLTFEWVMAAIIIGSVIYSIVHLWVYSYLPQPFFFEPEDSFADWFNTAYWARDPGTYDVWTTLYPPLSFVFLRLLSLDRCYLEPRAFDASVGYPSRECDWPGLVAIGGLALFNLLLIYWAFRKIDKKTALPRTVCLGLGWPMLDGLERGNLVLISFTCVLLAFGPILKSTRAKWMFAALAVNFKVYLIGGVVALLLKRKWHWVECAIIATVVVYLVTFAILGRGTLIELVRNVSAWSEVETTQPVDLWFSTTYNGLLSLIKSDGFPVQMIIGSANADLAVTLIPLMVLSVQGLIVLAAAAIWLRPEAVSSYRAVTLALMLALITSESGGYTPVYYTVFILMEPWRGAGRKWAIAGCYFLAPALDLSLSELPPLVRNTYFRESTTIATFHVTLIPFIRPLMILSIASAISLTTIREVWCDVREDGWSDRWRFRRDLPLLPWVRRPSNSTQPSHVPVK